MLSSSLLLVAIFLLRVGDVIGENPTDPDLLRSLPRVNFIYADAKESEVNFIYFSRTSRNKGKHVTRNTVSKVVDKKLRTVFIIHGYTSDSTEPWYSSMRDNYFKIGRYNIIYVDWAKPANKSYFVSFANIEPVSHFIGEFIIQSKIPFENIHLVGHSLGAQLSGYIGKYVMEKTNKKLDRITGLDPAAPMFEFAKGMENDEKLNRDDAEFVDIVHTNIKIYGLTAPIGHVDFYPNKGEFQPGCPKESALNTRCSHARAPQFFAESIVTKVEAQEAIIELAERIEDTEMQLMSDGKHIIFGQHVDYKARGVYYLKTNPHQPFLIDKQEHIELYKII